MDTLKVCITPAASFHREAARLVLRDKEKLQAGPKFSQEIGAVLSIQLPCSRSPPSRGQEISLLVLEQGDKGCPKSPIFDLGSLVPGRRAGGHYSP
jgi:hypothetical protein